MPSALIYIALFGVTHIHDYSISPVTFLYAFCRLFVHFYVHAVLTGFVKGE